jgi:hypothetical protein
VIKDSRVTSASMPSSSFMQGTTIDRYIWSFLLKLFNSEMMGL